MTSIAAPIFEKAPLRMTPDKENVVESPSSAYTYYREKLLSARFFVAPMVDASELAWRLLGRRYGAQVCFTPMWHAGVFVRDEKYRRDALAQTLTEGSEDEPLIAQFCANDAKVICRAVQLMLDDPRGRKAIVGVDLNLGCPQIIAKRGHFGSFLQDDWPLIREIVCSLKAQFGHRLGISCKIRVFDSLDRTIDYALMLEQAGCQLLTVHGRTREQKGAMTGVASWKHIKAIKQALRIPVIANGNIQYLKDVHQCMQETGVDGVMSAEGHLSNPALFSGQSPPVWKMAKEYLDLVSKYPCPLSYSRGHIFKMLHHCFQRPEMKDLREKVAKANCTKDLEEAVHNLQQRIEAIIEQDRSEEEDEALKTNTGLYYWLCQPYIRPPPSVHLAKMEALRTQQEQNSHKRELEPEEGSISKTLSKKKMKKLERYPNKQFGVGRKKCPICQRCPNPAGLKCEFGLCRQCCRSAGKEEKRGCAAHKVFGPRENNLKENEERKLESKSSDCLVENNNVQEVNVK